MQQEQILDSPDKDPQEDPGKAYKKLRNVEMPILVIFMAGLSFRLMSWPGGSMLLIAGLSLLSLLYFVSWIAPVIDKRNNTTIGYSAIVSLALSVGVVGVLFHFMIWPNSLIMLMIGVAIGGPSLIAGIIMQFTKSPLIHKQSLTWSIFRLVPILAWSSFYLFTRGVPI